MVCYGMCGLAKRYINLINSIKLYPVYFIQMDLRYVLFYRNLLSNFFFNLEFLMVFFLLLRFQVVSNTEVWDLRTFHLLRTVPTLDQCLVTFSPLDVIYGISYAEVEHRFDIEQVSFSYEPSFKTLDSYDYSSIGTANKFTRF